MKSEEIVQRLEIDGIYDHKTKKTFWPLRKELLEEANQLLLMEVAFVSEAEDKIYTVSIVANSLGFFFLPRDWREKDANPQSFAEAAEFDWMEMRNGTPAVWIDGVLFLESS